jgi:hypothetical protein
MIFLKISRRFFNTDLGGALTEGPETITRTGLGRNYCVPYPSAQLTITHLNQPDAQEPSQDCMEKPPET